MSHNALTEFDAGVLHGLSGLWTLSLNHNSIVDISALSALANLGRLFLAVNSISNVEPLVANVGLGGGDLVRLDGNPWSAASRLTHIPALRQRGVNVFANHAVVIGDASATEGEPLVFTVVVHPAWPDDLTLDWQVLDIAGVAWAWPGRDFPANQKGTLTISAGESHGRFFVQTSQDDVVEHAEAFLVQVDPPAGGLPDGMVMDTIWGEATILDDDLPSIQNEAPQAVSVLPDLYTVVGARTGVAAAGSFDDPNGDALAISAVSSDPAVAVLVEAGVVTVEAIRPGLAAVVVTATDPHGETAAITFPVRVSTSRQAVVGANDELALALDEAVRLDLLASFRELDEHALVFVAESSAPTVATVDVGRNWATVEAGSQGSATIVLTATAPTGETTTLTFTVTVGATPSRRGLPLWLLSIPNRSGPRALPGPDPPPREASSASEAAP